MNSSETVDRLRPSTAAPEVAPAPARARSGAGRTILVVDDELDTLGLIRDFLEFEGFHVVTVSGGKECVAAVAAEPPDLILLDLMMPDMNGFDVCGVLARAGLPFRPPILVITGLEAFSDQSRCLCDLFEINEFLYKPFARADLVGRVHALLERSNLRRLHG